ncbi:glycosyltransferase family 4 protein [Halosegnis marinus]|uniref:Glycosyltransferase family 4 protein n=1 Tax=Halosegnis marinus TaxID=3034023 RepID=A0ABD5ZQU4_9EURY|nr:glycosyltransferase family 4 protein [Halosegnis sp. DT85]
MRVSHYFEWERFVTGGQAQSVRNQRRVMDDHGIEYTTKPDLSADLLHLNNMGPRSTYYAARARRAGVPVVAHTHQTAADFENSFAFSNVLAKPMRPYLERAYSLADVLVCPSEHNRAVVAEYTDTPTRVISNGFDPAKLAGHDDPALRQEYLDRYDLDPPVVFNVAHVLERKGLATFVETARRMPDTDFVWFGYLNPTGGFLGQFLQSSASKRLVESAPENCTFTGYVEDIAGAFAAGDVFYFPTHNENEGMALLEAMSVGAPPVVRSIDTYEWLAEGETCRKADSVEGFEAALRDLLDDPDERERIGANAREKSADFTLDTVGESLVGLYRDLTENATD